MRKSLYSIPGYTIRCNSVGYISIEYNKTLRNETTIWKPYDKLEWITKHIYVLKNMEKRILNRKILIV